MAYIGLVGDNYADKIPHSTDLPIYLSTVKSIVQICWGRFLYLRL